MKKILITLAMMIPVLAGFASKPEINPEVLHAFTKMYDHATDVSWEEGDNYYKATFTSGGNTTYAFYTPDGKQISLAKHILSSGLPARLQKQLVKNYRDFWISDLFEQADGRTVHYYITLKNSGNKIMLKGTKQKGWKEQ
jgi:hypothetical protein